MNDTPASQILVEGNIFEEFKGAFTEQYVCQEIVSLPLKPYYYSNEKSTMEIDFVIQKENVYPIEVKAEENLRSKSLREIIKDNEKLKGWRFSMGNYRDQGWMVNIPLYCIHQWMQEQL